MRYSPSPVGILGKILAVVGVVVSIVLGGIAQVSEQLRRAASQTEAEAAAAAQDLPPCASTSSTSSAGPALSQVNQYGHSVKLSWKASVPIECTTRLHPGLPCLSEPDVEQV